MWERRGHPAGAGYRQWVVVRERSFFGGCVAFRKKWLRWLVGRAKACHFFYRQLAAAVARVLFFLCIYVLTFCV